MTRTTAWKFFAAAMVLIMISAFGAGVITPGPVEAATPIFVNASTGNDSWDGTSATPGTAPVGPKKTIQAGVDVVDSGGIVNVAEYAYTEQVMIWKPLTLRGPSIAHSALIKAPDTRSVYKTFQYIVADNLTTPGLVRLENLVIDADGKLCTGGSYFAGVLLDNVSGTGAGIYNCNIYGFNAGDINSTGVVITGTSTLTIDFCGISSFNAWGIYADGADVNLTVTGDNITAGNDLTYSACIDVNGGIAEVDGNYISGGVIGVVGDGSKGLIITGNTILNQHDYGIDCRTTTGTVLIEHNLINGINSGVGDGIYNNGLVTNGSIVHNEIYDCKTAINLDYATSTWSVTQNLIHGCSVIGVNFDGLISEFSQNAIYDCMTGIDVWSTPFTAHCNAILGNTTAGLTLHQNGTYDVINNYWGSNSGPNIVGEVPTGTGDKILRNNFTGLTFDPWMVILMSAAPATVVADGTSASTVTIDCTKNSNGASTGCVIPILVYAVFNTNLGSFSGANPVTRPLVDGMASAALSSGTVGTATVTGYITDVPGHSALTEPVTTQVVFAPISTITSVNPASGLWGQSLPVIITGTNFAGATAVSFGTGITVNSFTVDSATQITANISIAGGSAPGARDVSVTTQGSVATLTNGFMVIPLMPSKGSGSGSSSLPGAATSAPAIVPAAITVQSASLSAKSVTPGTPVTVTADIANKSTVNGIKKVTLYVNGQVETTQGVTVNSGGSSQLSFNVSRSEPGDYTVYVDGVPAGSFKVELLSGNDGILIFSAVLIALAFLVGMVMLRRRQQHTA